MTLRSLALVPPDRNQSGPAVDPDPGRIGQRGHAIRREADHIAHHANDAARFDVEARSNVAADEIAFLGVRSANGHIARLHANSVGIGPGGQPVGRGADVVA